MPITFTGARKLTREQARLEEALYWSTKTIAERIAAARELTTHLYRMRGIDVDREHTGFTVRRVPRRAR